jgi:hypothetical protein
MLESAPISGRSLGSSGHASPNFFELFTHDGGGDHEQQGHYHGLPPFFMPAPELQAADMFVPPFNRGSSSIGEEATSWWTEGDMGEQHHEAIDHDSAWPSAFQRVLDSMAVDLESGNCS